MEINIPAKFSLDDLRAFLVRGQEEPPEGYHTTIEWADMLQVSEYTMGRMLRRAQTLGVLRRQKVLREAIDGAMRRTAVYAFDLQKGS